MSIFSSLFPIRKKTIFPAILIFIPILIISFCMCVTVVGMVTYHPLTAYQARFTQDLGRPKFWENLFFYTGLSLAIDIGLGLYFLPTWVAAKRDNENFWLVAMVNVFAGWTGVVWLICLIWASQRKSVVQNIYGPPRRLTQWIWMDAKK